MLRVIKIAKTYSERVLDPDPSGLESYYIHLPVEQTVPKSKTVPKHAKEFRH